MSVVVPIPATPAGQEIILPFLHAPGDARPAGGAHGLTFDSYFKARSKSGGGEVEIHIKTQRGPDSFEVYVGQMALPADRSRWAEINLRGALNAHMPGKGLNPSEIWPGIIVAIPAVDAYLWLEQFTGAA